MIIKVWKLEVSVEELKWNSVENLEQINKNF
jgi:hypothetical protein